MLKTPPFRRCFGVVLRITFSGGVEGPLGEVFFFVSFARRSGVELGLKILESRWLRV